VNLVKPLLRNPLALAIHGTLALPVLAILFATGSAAQSPVVAGLEGQHGLSQQEMGQVLLSELGCANCHGTSRPARPSAPRLTDVGGRLAPGYIERFIADPNGTQPGTRMPDVLGQVDATERAAVARSLTHFLVSRSEHPFATTSLLRDESLQARGRMLFRRVGCVACHGPGMAAEGEPAEPPAGLRHVPAKYSQASLAAFLFQPLHVRPGGRMPDMGLNQGEAQALAHYLLDGQQPSSGSFEVDPQLVHTGRVHFGELGCANCHTDLDVAPLPPTTPLKASETLSGCMADAGAARFSLSDVQRDALQLASAHTAVPLGPDPARTIARTLAEFNCLACHGRDGHGGPQEAWRPHFQTTEFELGDEARIPPDLTGVGAKLTRAWMEQVLFDGASVRAYMLTRMPRFGAANLAHLPQAFEAADEPREVTLRPANSKWKDGEWAKVAREAGRQLLGNEGLGCVLCHDFNSHPSPGQRGLDLISSPDRLRPAWFMDFLVAPEKLRPGIVMPQSWPAGVAVHDGILDGDTQAQLEAIWFYLSLGRSAADPVGIRTQGSHLTVGERVLTYRGRSGIAGYRGIAVGFPEHLSYAFNAQNGTLSGLWKGEFVSVNWNGQGSGNFNPKARAVTLPQDVTFCRLDDVKQAWPLAPTMNDEQPINPNPLYARNLGYRFRGYYMGQQDRPTFMYSSGPVEIEDSSQVVEVAGQNRLQRSLVFTATEADTLSMRVLTGLIVSPSPGVFATPDLRVTLPDLAPILRPGIAEATQELLLQIHLEPGQTSITLNYELLR